MAGTYDAQINTWVNAVQMRDATDAQLALYNSQLSSGLTQAQVQANIIAEGFTLANVNPVVRMYQAAFGRIPDQPGQNNWVDQLAAGQTTVAKMGDWFASAPEFANLYNGANAQTPANKQIVDQFYFNVLRRAPDAQGEAFWINSGLKAGQLLAAFSESAEFIGSSTPLAQQFQQLEINAATGGAPLPSVYTPLWDIGGGGTGTYTLTTNVDTINATFPTNVVNGLFAGGATDTVNPGDTITAPVGSATTLNITDTHAGAGADELTGVTLTNVSNLTVRAVTAGSTSTLNVASAVGMRTLTDQNSLNTSVRFQNVGTGASIVQTGSGTAGAHDTRFNYNTATDAVNVTVDGGVGRNGATAVTATAGTATAATINSTGAANGVTTAGAAAPTVFTLSGGTSTIKTLAVNAATDLNATLVAADYAATLAGTITGAASKVDLGTAAIFKTIDSTGLTGGLTVGVNGTLTSFKGGAGNDWLKANTTTASVVSATATIDSGAGFDTVNTTLINAGNSGVFKGFDQLDITGQGATTLDASLLTQSTITDVAVAGAIGGNAGLTNLVETAAGFNLHVFDGANVGRTTTLGFTAASITGTSDVLNVDFFNKAGAAINGGTYVTTGIEQIKLASSGLTGSANTIAFTDDNLQSVTLTGDKAITLSVTAQGLVGSATATALTTIDGSALTAGLTFSQNGPGAGNLTGLTIKGGTVADTITVVTAASGAATGYGASTVTLNGGNDSLTVSGATIQVATNAAAFTTVTDLTAGDTITFTGGAGTFVTAKVDVSAATDFIGAVTLAATAAGATAGAAAWFQYGGNTYFYENGAAGPGVTAADQIVKMTGLLDLSTSTYAAGVLTVA